MTYGVLVGVNLFDFGDCSKKLCFFDIKLTFQFGQLLSLRHCHSKSLKNFNLCKDFDFSFLRPSGLEPEQHRGPEPKVREC